MENPRNKTAFNVKTLSEMSEAFQDVDAAATSENTITLSDKAEVLFVEPFYGGSHKQLIDTLRQFIPNSSLICLTPKKWPWRARCSALVMSSMIPEVTTEKILFCSSVLSLAELLGLRPDLNPLRKIVYFHENQLIYPIREIKARDIQYAYNQITTCLSADLIVFNSNFNKNSFLDNLKNIFKIFPDYKPRDIRRRIEAKCNVLYIPLELPACCAVKPPVSYSLLRIVWPHRWEFDKDPEMFLKILVQLKLEGFNFQVALLGETYADAPESINNLKEILKDRIIINGFIKNKENYHKILQVCHVAVSTAVHEFFGISMLEASVCGCIPLAPNRLVYPEIFPEEFLYKDGNDLYRRLKAYCVNPQLCQNQWELNEPNFKRFFNNSSDFINIFTNI